MTHQTWEKTFPANVSDVPAMMTFVTEAAEACEMHPKRVLHLQLAVEEAAVNVCNYAYEVPPGEIIIHMECKENKFIVRIQDEGVPFDPLKLDTPDLKASIEDREVGGLGVYLMKRVMDEVHYVRIRGRNILTLIVNLHQ
jgi:anti-sigma regulatory factor (Ser/Thr protein kinase)